MEAEANVLRDERDALKAQLQECREQLQLSVHNAETAGFRLEQLKAEREQARAELLAANNKLETLRGWLQSAQEECDRLKHERAAGDPDGAFVLPLISDAALFLLKALAARKRHGAPGGTSVKQYLEELIEQRAEQAGFSVDGECVRQL